MFMRTIFVISAGLIAAPAVVVAEDTASRTVEQYTCKNVMRESGSGRDTAIAFLHGYLLGKSGSSEFNVETLTKQTDAFIDRCLDDPTAKAEEVMVQIKK